MLNLFYKKIFSYDNFNWRQYHSLFWKINQVGVVFFFSSFLLRRDSVFSFSLKYRFYDEFVFNLIRVRINYLVFIEFSRKTEKRVKYISLWGCGLIDLFQFNQFLVDFMQTSKNQLCRIKLINFGVFFIISKYFPRCCFNNKRITSFRTLFY